VPLLALGALGVVFGDIGTSGLYTLRAAFQAPPPVTTVGRESVLGLISLLCWALILVISVKYLLFVMRADNRGEGGILALLALVAPRRGPPTRQRAALVAIGLFGAALIYGDGAITPAISVLAAVEGLEGGHPVLARLVVPITVVILLILFLSQHRGTGRIGLVFGPVMLIWFLSIAALGIGGIVRHPDVLVAVSPVHGWRFLTGNGLSGFLILGVVVLGVTGAEALYADMGHFGARPIRVAWYALVFPALLLNYFGQGAILLHQPGAAAHPFYALVPAALHYPVVILATVATVFDSQALISGAFSLTQHAIQLGYFPRVRIRHTSTVIPGQIFIPAVNITLMMACLALVLGFRASDRLASAYGMAVAGAMATTSFLFFFVARDRWRWGVVRAGGLAALFLLIDLAFVAANVVKIPRGAWIPLVIAIVVYTIMATWRAGMRRIGGALRPVPVVDFLARLTREPPVRVPGTGVFVAAGMRGVPHSVTHLMERTNALPRQLVLLSLIVLEVPRVAEAERVEVQRLRDGVYRVGARYGFMETPHIPYVLARAAAHGVPLDPGKVTYFLSVISLLVTERPGLARWRKGLFEILWRNAQPASLHFQIPPVQVVEVGAEVEL
jgi:KUP system potassium uptake protein